MKVIVTGAGGFIGRHVIAELLSRGHEVTAVDRDPGLRDKLDSDRRCRLIQWDTHVISENIRDVLGEADAVMHLAWAGLPNYKALFHYEVNLPADYLFLKSLVMNGYSQFMVAGTCLEYGMRNGCLNESMATKPAIPYALAKDTLRKFLEMLQLEYPFSLQWARLFYMYGKGQNPKSLLSLLDQAIARGDAAFDMSGGDQLRDYLPVEQVAHKLVLILENKNFNGTVNICSGRPISIRKLVERHLSERNQEIALNLGYYPYTDYEPMAFWGDTSKFQRITAGADER